MLVGELLDGGGGDARGADPVRAHDDQLLGAVLVEVGGAERLYAELSEAGMKVLIDDRDAGPGEKFADAELLGVPLRLTVGKRALESERAEAQARRGRADHDGGVPLRGAAEAVRELWATLP